MQLSKNYSAGSSHRKSDSCSRDAQDSRSDRRIILKTHHCLMSFFFVDTSINSDIFDFLPTESVFNPVKHGHMMGKYQYFNTVL